MSWTLLEGIVRFTMVKGTDLLGQYGDVNYTGACRLSSEKVV